MHVDVGVSVRHVHISYVHDTLVCMCVYAHVYMHVYMCASVKVQYNLNLRRKNYRTTVIII